MITIEAHSSACTSLARLPWIHGTSRTNPRWKTERKTMCRQSPQARRTVRALSCTPNRIRFPGWSCHEDSPFTDISRLVVDLQRARSGSDAPCTPPCSSPACRDACRCGAYVRRVCGASSIRHSSVVAAARCRVVAPHTRYRAFPPPWFRIVTVSRLRGSFVSRSASSSRHIADADQAADLGVSLARWHRPAGVELELRSIPPHRVHRHGETPGDGDRSLVMPLMAFRRSPQVLMGVRPRYLTSRICADGVQPTASTVTNRVVDRGLATPPTIRLEAGKRISVIVTRHMRF